MLFRDFNDRAIECLQLATRTNSANDRTLFNQMAFAWLGRMEHLPSGWIVPRDQAISERSRSELTLHPGRPIPFRMIQRPEMNGSAFS
jgi:hypothetical protein